MGRERLQFPRTYVLSAAFPAWVFPSRRQRAERTSRQRQVDINEFSTNLVYRVIPGQPGLGANKDLALQSETETGGWNPSSGPVYSV